MNQAAPQTSPDVQGSSSRLLEVYAPIADALNSVNDLLKGQIELSGPVLAERLAQSGLSSGKRVRPALLLLCGAATGDLKKTHVAAAAAVELVHAATLVHDDVLDDADQRRHEPSLNAVWDNTTSILTGDFLFSKAFEVASTSGSMDAIRRIAGSSCRVCEGEILQNAASGNYEIKTEEYFEIIGLKTAELCKCSCGLGAVLSECDTETVEAFETYGDNLGIAFQIVDDVLDLVGQRQQIGKTLGTDLLNQKATLPIIHSLATLQDNADDRRAELLRQLKCSAPDHDYVLAVLNETESLQHASNVARQHAEAACSFAESLPESIYRDSLHQLADFVVRRTH